jgi:predicted porin
VDYSFSRAVTSFDLSSGGVADTTPLPDLTSDLHSFGLNADYHLQENMSLRFGYRFEVLHTEDYALDDVDVDTIGQVLTLGEGGSGYMAHVVAVSLSYQF